MTAFSSHSRVAVISVSSEGDSLKSKLSHPRLIRARPYHVSRARALARRARYLIAVLQQRCDRSLGPDSTQGRGLPLALAHWRWRISAGALALLIATLVSVDGTARAVKKIDQESKE